MQKAQIRNILKADEVVRLDKELVERVRIGGRTVGRVIFDPGWKGRKREACSGYLLSGRLTVRLPDGSRTIIEPGDFFTLPAGHDAAVTGGAPAVVLELALA